VRDIDIDPAGVQPAPDAAIVKPSLNMTILSRDDDIGVRVRHLLINGKPAAHRASLQVIAAKRTGTVTICKKSMA
jgi:hypothetical protein